MKRRIDWTLSRMRRLFEIWEKLDVADKNYCLGRIRDEEPDLFYAIANAKKR